MRKHTLCPECQVRNKSNAIYCSQCGSLLHPSEHTEDPSLIAVPEEIFHHIFLINGGMLTMLKNLVVSPGRSLIDYSKKKGSIKKATVYFLVSISIYTLLNELIFKRFKYHYNLCGNFSFHVGLIILSLLLLGIAVIGFITLGYWRSGGRRKDDYPFPRVLTICFFIYGTNYFLAPIIVVLANYFHEPLIELLKVSNKDLAKITDIPLALFMIYMLLMLVINTPTLKYKSIRYTAFVALSLTYYISMYENVVTLQNKINGILEVKEEAEKSE
jgi:hypothetical protein